MKRCKFFIIIFIAQMILVGGCRLLIEPSPKTWSASEFRYIPTCHDTVYLSAYRNLDTSSLTLNNHIRYVLTPDSLIVFENNIIRKYYVDFFEIHKFELPTAYLYVNRYLYNNELVFEKCFYNNLIEWEKVNINGVVYLKNVNISTKF
jgi:hypothetical protein